MKRRTWLVAALMGTAGGATTGWAVWRHRDQASEKVAAAWWNSRFPQPGGGELRPAQWRGQPVLLNFWAPWCKPCVEELPLLDRFYQEHTAQRWHVIGVAIDTERAVQTFLRQHPVSFPVGLSGLYGVDLSKALGNPSGLLPFSVVFNSAGHVADQKLGLLKSEDLSRWVQVVD